MTFLTFTVPGAFATAVETARGQDAKPAASAQTAGTCSTSLIQRIVSWFAHPVLVRG